MRTQTALALVAGALLLSTTASGAYAATYLISYTFNTGDTVTADVGATGPITDLTDITVYSVKVDGAPVAGRFSVYSYTGYSGPTGPNCDYCYAPGGATVSSSADSNNFLFDNGTDYWYVIPWNNGPGDQEATQAVTPGGTIDPYNGDFLPGNFSVIAAPEPATWTMLLVGGALAGALLRRRERALA